MKVKPTAKLRDKDRGLNKAVAVLKGFKGWGVKVGVLGTGQAASRPEWLETALLAAVHEFGAPSRGIPARHWITEPIDKKRREYADLLQGMVERAFDAGRGTVRSPKFYFDLIGMRAANDVKQWVFNGDVRPLQSYETLVRKLRKGERQFKRWRASGKKLEQAGDNVGFEGPSKLPRTLIDTGRMVGAVTWLAGLVGDLAPGGRGGR
jgi:hypothetical protein